MSPSYLQRVRNFLKCRRSARSANPTPGVRLYRPGLERLEDRLAPATYTWNNLAGGDWDTVSNWSVGGATATTLPGASDDVVINNLNAGATVTHTQGSVDSVASVTATAPITLSNGYLEVSGSFSDSNTVTFPGGTISNVTAAAGTQLSLGGGPSLIMTAVTLSGMLALNSKDSPGVTINQGLTLDNGTVQFNNSIQGVTLAGNGADPGRHRHSNLRRRR